MNPVELDTNLIPRDIRQFRTRRNRIRLWTIVCGSYVGAVGVVSLATLLVIGGRATSALSQLKDLAEQSAESKSQMAKIEPMLKSQKQRLESRRVLAEQPDTGQLLSLISSCVESDVILRQVTVTASGVDSSAKAAPGKPIVSLPGAEREPRHFDIMIRGVSKTEKGVSRLSDHLRGIELFDEVELQRTGRDASGAMAVAFEVACTLRDGGGGGK